MKISIGPDFYQVQIKMDLRTSTYNNGKRTPPKVTSDMRRKMKKESRLLFREFKTKREANQRMKVAKQRYGDIFEVSELAHLYL